MDPALLLSLIARLPDTSMTTALASGGRHLFGWGQDRYLAADIYDAVNIGTLATGQFTTRPKFEPYPRPKVTKIQGEKKPQRVNIKELYRKLSGAAAAQKKE